MRKIKFLKVKWQNIVIVLLLLSLMAGTALPAMADVIKVKAPPALDDISDVNAATPADDDVLYWNDGASEWQSRAEAGGGDVTGAGSSTDNMIARHDGVGGDTLQDYTSNPPTISDTGDMNIDGDLDVESIVVSGNVDGIDVSAHDVAPTGVHGAGAESLLHTGDVGTMAAETATDYVQKSTFTQDGGVLVGTGAGTFAEEAGATLRTSLGLGTGDSPEFHGINLGDADDCTLLRIVAGVATIEGDVIITQALVADIPVNDDHTIPISSNWAFDHNALTFGVHGIPVDPNNDRYLMWDDVPGELVWGSPTGGGDVVGPGSSTDNAIARFDSTTGKIIQDYTSNPPTISDTGDMNIDGDIDVDNVIVSGDVDGRDVSVDGAKLDGIEALADVTDAANVATAGALMDSGTDIITNLHINWGSGVGQVDADDIPDSATKFWAGESGADVTDAANVAGAGALMVADLENPPTEDETSKAPTSEWAFDHDADGTAHQSNVITITFIIDGGGSAITTGQKGHIELPFACTITGWTLLGDQSGSIVIDVWNDTYANFPPTVADTIAGSEKPTLSSVQKNQDLALGTWTTAVGVGDILAFNVDSVATVERVTLSIRATKT